MDKTKLKPTIMVNTEIIGIIEQSMIGKWNVAWVIIIITTNSANMIKKFKNSDITAPKTKIYLGAGVLCKIDLFPLSASMDEDIEEVKNWNKHHPHKK